MSDRYYNCTINGRIIAKIPYTPNKTYMYHIASYPKYTHIMILC